MARVRGAAVAAMKPRRHTSAFGDDLLAEPVAFRTSGVHIRDDRAAPGELPFRFRQDPS